MGDEESPMTMQVGMVGSNGIVLASDRRWNMKSALRGDTWGTSEHSLQSSKIKIDEARGIAIACAADLILGRTLADKILAALEDQYIESPEATIKAVAKPMAPRVGSINPPHCLIVFKGPPARLFDVFYIASSGTEVVPEFLELDAVGIAGHTTNAALYWAERYNRIIPKLPVERLIPLAAHLVVSAGIINPGGISGLEIIYCDVDGFHRLSKSENLDWEAKAVNWDKRIGKMILGSKVP